MHTLNKFVKRYAAFSNRPFENSSSPDVRLINVGTLLIEAVRVYEARERESRITDDLVDRIAAHPEDYDVAANRDPNARLEAETPDE